MLHHPEQAVKKVSDEAFEEEIRELDKEKKKYDIILTMAPGLRVSTGKENIVSQHCINELKVSCPTAHTANILGPTSM